MVATQRREAGHLCKSLIGASLCFCLALAHFTYADAAPEVYGVQGTVSDGSSVAITGTGFGDNGPSIVLFDDFESGLIGQNIKIGSGSATVGVWNAVGGGNNTNIPKYSGTYKVSGSKSFKADHTKATSAPDDSSCAAYATFSPTRDVYLSYWMYIPTSSSMPCYNGASCNLKVVWLTGAGSVETGDQVVPVILDQSGQPSNYWNISCNGCASNPPEFDTGMRKGQWWRISAYVHGTTSTTSRRAFWTLSPDAGKTLTANLSNISTPVFKSDSTFTNFALSPWARRCNDCAESNAYYDDVYVATGQYARARVEIGNKSTYNSCTKLSITTPTSWSNTGITTTIRQGSFTSGETAYLYVVNSNGDVNSSGFAVTIGKGNGSGPPLPPENLHIN